MASFYRPTDQNPPIVEQEEIENLFRCLDVDSILQVYCCLLLEKKVLVISKHKALLTQVIYSFMTFMFPFQWKHCLIPILPMNNIEMLDAPFPYFVGIEPNPYLDELDIENEVVRVDLDQGIVFTPEEMLLQSSLPSLPSKEYRVLKQRLMKASEHFGQIPD